MEQLVQQFQQLKLRVEEMGAQWEKPRAYKGSLFSGSGIPEVAEFIYKLRNAIDMQGIMGEGNKIQVLVSGVTGLASIWVRQRWAEQPNEDFASII